MIVPMAGAHGGDAVAIAHALGVDPDSLIDLSASLNPFAPDARRIASECLERDGSILRRYPTQGDAERQIAEMVGEDSAVVVLTNGAAEAIAVLAGLLERGAVVEPEFSLYARHLTTVAMDAPRWRSNPSNPLGQLAAADDEALVWDESFYPLATGEWTGGRHSSWRIGSLTKVWACPGLRLGYVIAPDPDAAGMFRRRQPHWAVNGIALAAIPALIEQSDLPGWHTQLHALRLDFASRLGEMGFAVTTTVANWLLINAPGLRERLAVRGVVVRDCSSFGLPGVVRVAIPRPTELDTVVAAFAACAR